MIAIVNYGIGNVRSVIKAFSLFYDNVVFTDSVNQIKNAKAIVLPGVSSFGSAINNLNISSKYNNNTVKYSGISNNTNVNSNINNEIYNNNMSDKKMSDIEINRSSTLFNTIIKEINKGKLFLGICIGIQLLFEESEESPEIQGLSVFKGNVTRFPRNLTVPHIGWNNVNFLNSNNPLFNGIKNLQFFYFVHSYYVNPTSKSIVIAETEYSDFSFPSAINKDNIYALQFHPEKSQQNGLKIIENFVKLC